MEGNLVRLSVEVDEPEFDKALGDVVRTLAQQVRVPGFRPGKVPRKVLEARMGGAGALRAEALRESLPDFYARAVVDTELDPIAQPEIDITGGEDGGGVSFDAVVQVRPIVAIPGYDGLQVTLPGLPSAMKRCRASSTGCARTTQSSTVVDRPAIDGDFVTIDLHGNDATGAEVVGVDDYLYEVGSGSVVPELDAELHGAKAGAILAFDAANPNEPEENVAFRVLVKEVKVKKLPEATDEWAAESSEFATVAEFARTSPPESAASSSCRVRWRCARRASKPSRIWSPTTWSPRSWSTPRSTSGCTTFNTGWRLRSSGLAEYFQATGTTPDELLAAVRVDALWAVKADLALRALVEAEELTLSDEELLAEIVTMAERMGTTPVELRRQLDTAGRTGAVRSELRKGKALEWLLDHVELVDEEGNPMSRDDLKVDASGEGEVEQNEESE